MKEMYFSGRLERTVRFQRILAVHNAVRPAQRRCDRSVPVSFLYPEHGGPRPIVFSIEGRRGFALATYIDGICERAESDEGATFVALRLRSLPRKIRRILLRLRQPGDHRSRRRRSDGLCTNTTSFR